MDFDREHDERVRSAAFGWLASQVSAEDGVVLRNVLANGFEHGGVRVRFVGPQGIFKPSIMELPLSITTSPNSPYDDEMGSDKLLQPPLSFGYFPRERGKREPATPIPT